MYTIAKGTQITNKLLNLVGGGNAETGYESVASYLKDRMKRLKHLRGDGGEINELLRKITDLNSKISKENAENQSRLSFFSEEKRLQEEINVLEKEISDLVIKEISSRLEFLINVGLEYLTLDREAKTLSGGEAQRIRLAT